MDGVDLVTVQQLLGHQYLNMTLKYAHLSPEHRQAAVDRLAGRTGKLGVVSLQHGTNLAQAEISETAENAEIVAN